VEVVVFNPGEVSITGQTVKFEFDSLSSSKKGHLDDSSLKALEVPESRDPEDVEEEQINIIILPSKLKRVHEEHEKSHGHKGFVQDVRILEIDGHMLERVARVNKDLTDSVEFEGVRRLIYTSSLFNDGQIGKFFGLIL